MTKLQVDYWNMKINEALAKETERSHRAQEALGSAELDETTRHNIAGEVETHRHNVESELVTRDSLIETNRHNAATEANEASKLSESSRHNRAMEAEQFRTDTANEAIKRESNAIQEKKNSLDYLVNSAKNAIQAESNDIRRAELDNAIERWKSELGEKWAELAKSYDVAVMQNDTQRRNANIQAMTSLINQGTSNLTSLVNNAGKNAYYVSRALESMFNMFGQDPDVDWLIN